LKFSVNYGRVRIIGSYKRRRRGERGRGRRKGKRRGRERERGKGGRRRREGRCGLHFFTGTVMQDFFV
jgi:hypothetical protein